MSKWIVDASGKRKMVAATKRQAPSGDMPPGEPDTAQPLAPPVAPEKTPKEGN